MAGQGQNVENVDEKVSADDRSSQVPTINVEEVVYLTGLKLIMIIVALCLAMFLISLDQTIVATAIPRITDHFHSVQDIGWYGSVSSQHFHRKTELTTAHHQAYFLTATSLQPSFGRIYKTFSVCFFAGLPEISIFSIMQCR